MIFVAIISTFLIFSVKCASKFEDPAIIQQFSEYDYNRTRMLSAMSPYTMQEECTPIRAWLLTRHGTKNPSKQIINDFSKELKGIQNKLKEIYKNKDDENYIKLKPGQKNLIRHIIEWENFLSGVEHKSLNENGKLMMSDFGKRLNNKLKKLTKTLKADEIEVLSAEEDRCLISAKKILSSFFEGDCDEIDVIKNKYDKRLKLDKPLDSKIKIHHEKSEKLKYVEDYYFEKHCPEITDKIRNLLFPNHISEYETYRQLVTNNTVKTMYYACAYGFSHSDKHGNLATNWCWVFNFKDLKMFENMHDLQYFYKNGYYLEDNRKLGNKITKDILNFIENPSGIKFKLFVGHTANCMSVITRLNLFRDNVKLTVDNIDEMNSRKWRTSFITPVGCNIMVVVYDCLYATLKVSIYVNEFPVKMVYDNGYSCVKCPLEEIVELIKSFNIDEEYEPENPTEADKQNKIMKKEMDKIRETGEKYKKETIFNDSEKKRRDNAFPDEI